jgi:hypothetical protein
MVATSCSIDINAARVMYYQTSNNSEVARLERNPKVMGLDYQLHLINLKIYREKILPAYREFWEKDDPKFLIELLKEIIQKLDTNAKLPGPKLWSRASYNEGIGILNGDVYYSLKGEYRSNQNVKKTTRAAKRYFVKNSIGPDILLALCVPRDKGVDPVQNLGRSQMISYLFEKSEWINDLFTSKRFTKGIFLKISLGESPGQILTKENIQEFSLELAKVPPPTNPELRKEYDNLQEFLNLALKEPDLMLLLSLL